MEDNNKLIAEFMGFKTQDSPNERWHKQYFTQPNNAWGCRIEKLHFDTDWNWLMEVVEKIENIISDGIVFNVFIDKNKTHVFYAPANYSNEKWFSNLFLHEGDTKIKNTYNACIEVIKWYNKQNN